MADDRYYPQLFKRSNCGLEQKYYLWLSKLKRFRVKCQCGAKVTGKDIFFPAEVNVPVIKTMTKNRFYDGPSGRKEILAKYLHKPTLKRQLKKSFG
jgi:hypothetical protein